MTEQEAIKRINECRNTPNFQPYHYVNEALDMGIKALEKQIAKKPSNISEIDDNDNALVECPICHANSDYSVNTIKSGYCWKCGQKLDWGNEDAE